MSSLTRPDQPPAQEGATAEGEPATDGRLERIPGDAAAEEAAGDRDETGGRDEVTGDSDGERRGVRRVAAWVATGLACLLVLFALLAPDNLNRFTVSAFLRIPVEGLVGVLILLALPPRVRRVAAVLAGAVLGLLTILKFLDIGFRKTVARPFDVVLDWVLLGPAWEFVSDTYGMAGAIGVVAVAVALATTVLVFVPLAMLRLTGIVVRHRGKAIRTVAVLTVIALADTLAGRAIFPKVPISNYAVDRAQQVRAGLHDQEAFAATASVDAFRDTPGDELLTALRGKDVLLTFVESYGRDAIEDPAISPRVNAVLDDGNRRLRAAGYASRSAFLTSPTFGGSSWLAQSTFLSGLWIDNPQRYRNLVSSDRLTLPGAFQRAGWRTVAVAPGVKRAWPETSFYRYDKAYPSWDLQYRGPRFSWSLVPDQFTLSAFERLEHSKKDHPPLMAMIALVSSHTPWTPLPKFVGWNELGDGSIFGPMAAAGATPKAWRSTDQLRADYATSIEYSLTSLISYIETYGDEDLVLVFLGDHQPNPSVTGPGARWGVPITIVAHDRAVLDRVSGWGWHDGLRPGPQAPVWRMDEFRDRFLTAFGSQPRPAPSQSPATH